MFARIKTKTAVIAFFSVVPVLVVTALITAPCPVCNGTGQVNSTPGTEHVSILEFDYFEQQVQRDTCGVYIVFRYGASMSLLNEGEEDVDAWFQLTLFDMAREEPNNIVDTQYLQIHIPAKRVVNNSFSVVFGTGSDDPRRTEVRAEVVMGGVPDKTCNGTGRVSLNAWPFINALKTSFAEVIREVNPYHPPVAMDWAEYMELFFNE
jgi:hypothetical protein